MRITKRQLRRIIREAVASKTLFVTRGDYGYIGLEDDAGNEYNMGEAVAELLDAGITNLFRGSGGEDVDALFRLQSKRDAKVQGGMARWDSDVFEIYYNMDLDRIIIEFAELKGLEVEEATQEDEYEDDGEYDFESYYS